MVELTEKEIQRFKSNIDIKSKEECWIWKRAINSNSKQPVVSLGYKQHQARRVAYQIWVNNLSEIEDVKQVCYNNRCLNPDHLKLVRRKRITSPDRELKWCSGYDSFRPLDAFGLDNHSINGIRQKCKKCNVVDVQNYKRNNPRYYKTERNGHLLRSYNITIEVYDELWLKQDGKCAICKKPESDLKKRLAVDHDHSCCLGPKSCGKCIRGLLCYRCNTNLGYWKDDQEILKNAIAYLCNNKLNLR